MGIEPNVHQIPSFQGKYSYHTHHSENPERLNSPNVLSAIGCVGHWVGRKKYRQISLYHTRLRSTITRKTTADIRHAPLTVSGFR